MSTRLRIRVLYFLFYFPIFSALLVVLLVLFYLCVIRYFWSISLMSCVMGVVHWVFFLYLGLCPLMSCLVMLLFWIVCRFRRRVFCILLLLLLLLLLYESPIGLFLSFSPGLWSHTSNVMGVMLLCVKFLFDFESLFVLLICL